MRSVIKICILILIIFSCEKGDEKGRCKYLSEENQLFISFKINGLDNIFYQSGDYASSGYNTYYQINGKTIISMEYTFVFSSMELGAHSPFVNLKFYDTTLISESGLISIKTLKEDLLSDYRFIVPKRKPSDEGIYTEMAPEDSVFLRGVALEIYPYKYSTFDLINYFDFNIDTISKYLWKDSYFIINKSNRVCNNYYKLIEGEFATTLINALTNEFIIIEEGRFKILVNK